MVNPIKKRKDCTVGCSRSSTEQITCLFHFNLNVYLSLIHLNKYLTYNTSFACVAVCSVQDKIMSFFSFLKGFSCINQGSI